MSTITDTKARSIKPTDKTLPHGGVTGLSLVASKNKGAGYWELRYTSPTTTKRRVIGFGSYPGVSILDAGKLALSARELITQGIDPLEHRDKSEHEKNTMPTVEQAARILHADLSPSWKHGKDGKQGKQWISTMQLYVFPIIGIRPVNEITPALIANVLRPIWVDKADTASRVKQQLHLVMAWAWAHGYCMANPVDVVNHLLPKQEAKATRVQNHPAMPWRIVPAFVADSLKPVQEYESIRPLIEFIILTAVRSGEARGMVWGEVDLVAGVWTIPAERMKKKIQHRVPLSDRALALVESQQGRHGVRVFPAPRGGEFTDMTLSEFLKAHDATSSTPDRHATVHGFRSSFRDWASENQYPRDLAEKALAHSVANTTEAAYHRTDLIDLRRPMMQAWANHVKGIEATQADNVLVLKRA